jgi:hypothetical protein
VLTSCPAGPCYDFCPFSCKSHPLLCGCDAAAFVCHLCRHLVPKTFSQVRTNPIPWNDPGACRPPYEVTQSENVLPWIYCLQLLNSRTSSHVVTSHRDLGKRERTVLWRYEGGIFVSSVFWHKVFERKHDMTTFHDMGKTQGRHRTCDLPAYLPLAK